MIKSLEHTKPEEIVDCLHLAFSDYFIPMKMPHDFWYKRWEAARIDYRASTGFFEDDTLCAFMLHGIDEHEGKKSFFNMGTGVVPNSRGQRLVSKMYEYFLEKLKPVGLEQGILEVIQNNEKAIKAYKSVGFEIKRELYSFRGKSLDDEALDIEVKIHAYDPKIVETLNINYLPWEQNTVTAEKLGDGFDMISIMKNGEVTGFATLKKSNNGVMQCGVINNNWNLHGKSLINALYNINKDFKLVNLDANNKNLIDFLEKNNFETLIRQYEMHLDL